MAQKRILHISDIHCTTTHLRKISSIVDSYDLVIVSGDLECIDVVEYLASIAKRVLAITGNMDNYIVREKLREKDLLLDSRVVDVEGLKIAGISGLDVGGSLEELRSKYSGDLDILVTHQPPYGALDRTFIGIRAGSREIRKYVLEKKPLVNLCGHIHESRGITSLGETLVVNPGPLRRGYYAEVLVEPREKKAEAVLKKI